jgi:carbonic anhydrase/acetyltransferase-like protein (isoleucine patch superfamily)
MSAAVDSFLTLGADLIHETAWVHPDAVVIGRVEIGPEASVWPCAVLRGDGGRVLVGARTSVQDGVVVHVGRDLDTVLGEGCVVGHLAHLEGCTVGDGALVGSGSVLLQGVEVGAGALVAAGAVLPPGTVVLPLATARGVPAKVLPDTVQPGAFAGSADGYVERARRYAAELRRL